MTVSPHITRLQQGIFYLYCAVALGSVLLAFQTGTTFLLAIPAVLAVTFLTVLDYRLVYFILLAMLPCSIEYSFPSGLATDLPTEPLMAGLMLVTLTLIFFRRPSLPRGFFGHPLIALLMLHLFWIFVCAVNSGKPVFSFKVFFAKIWYFVPFTILTAMLIRRRSDVKKMFWCICLPLTVLIIITVLRHGILYQFSFSDINQCVGPYFRNHVNYAAMMSIFFPFLLWALGWYRPNTRKYNFIIFCIVLFIVAVYLSYTRTAMLAILGMIPFYYMVRWRMTKVVVVGVVLVCSMGVSWLLYDNHYLRFAPTYEETVYHYDFGSHLTSTFEGKDVSSMERVYRWVAAARMAHDRPYMGVGSGNFYNYYRSYTVNAFETYISDNDERSTVHNYYLLMLAEQGWIGLIIFLLLTFAVFIYGEYIYFRMQTRENKRGVMILLLVMFSIIINLLLSDMLESDKVGPFFFMAISMLALFDRGALSMEADGQ